MRRAARAVVLVALSAGCAATPPLPSPVGKWDATVLVSNGTLEVPFTFEIAEKDGALSAWFVDGDVKIPTTETRRSGNVLTLVFGQYGSTLEATFANDTLEGKYDRGTRRSVYPFKATRAAVASAPGDVPQIAGEWRIVLPPGGSRREPAWKFVARQQGADVSAAIMRVDGDSGTLSGRASQGTFVLSHFSGARPTRVEVTPKPDGTLEMKQDGRLTYVAYREDVARAQKLPEPADPRTYTSVRDPKEKFTFSFPDLAGTPVSDSDARFKNKVVIVSITGSWCPNCHDEAPFLSSLYRDYRERGLEIVGIAFEEADQLKAPDRVRAFIKQYDLSYPFVIGGTPDEAPEKIPQSVNMTTFPATFVLGKDGRVRFVHAGYASKATGEFYETEQKAFIDEIDRLLAEPSPS